MTRAQRLPIPAKVGDQNFDAHPRRLPPHCPDCLGKDARAAVRQIVTVNRRDNGVPDAHAGDGLRHAQRLQRVHDAARIAGLDGAIAAGARARIAQNHERGGAAIPAVADVGTARLLADGMERAALHKRLQLAVALAARRGNLEPLRQATRARNRLFNSQGHRAHQNTTRARKLYSICLGTGL